MILDYYGLTPFNLALDGTVDQFYEVYQLVYNSYLVIAQSEGFNLDDLKYYDHHVVQQTMGKIENLAFRRLRIFTKDFKKIHLQLSDFKYFTFFDSKKVESFKYEKYIEEHYLYRNLLDIENKPRKYDAKTNGVFFLQQTAISFANFLEIFQNLVIRAIFRIKKEAQPDYDYFDVRKTVLAHIKEWMKKRLDATQPVEGKKLIPNTETLYLFDSLRNTKCKQKAHPISTRQYNVLSVIDSNVIALPAHYCSQCNRYMMGSFSYSLFIKHYGKIVNRVDKCSLSSFQELLSESKLHMLGYTARNDGTTAFERQALLTHLISTGQITFFEVVSTIESDICQFRNHPNFIFAIPKWEADLKFINEWELERKQKK